MADAARRQPLRRPEARPGEAIDRSGLIEFTFDGVKHRAHPGDTVGSALAAAGVKTLSRSFKYHRPRGLLCCAGHCPNCLVQIGGEANVRACRRPVEAGMEVRSQNAWPSLDRDLMSLAGLGAPLMPVGFYYKTFIRPARLWPLYERVLRRAAGLGSVDQDAVPAECDKQYLHADVAVVGAGPAGIAAAAAAAREGARVLLFDENSEAGEDTCATAPGVWPPPEMQCRPRWRRSSVPETPSSTSTPRSPAGTRTTGWRRSAGTGC